MSKRTLAFIAASFVAVFYGANYTIAKDVMPQYIEPLGFIVLRVFIAALLFWLIAIWAPKEKIDKKDYVRIFVVAFFGIGLNMPSFFLGLSLTSPINASVIMVTVPIIVLILSVFFLKEKLTLLKVLGMLIGLFGALIIISYGSGNHMTATNPILGNILVFLNAISYAIYIIIVKKMTQKYHPFTFIKWMYTIGFFIVLPLGYNELMSAQLSVLPTVIYLKIGYVIVFATFATYMLNIFAIRELKPITVSVFVYLQPLLATGFAIFLGSDQIDGVKVVAALLIFIGVYLASKPSKVNKIIK